MAIDMGMILNLLTSQLIFRTHIAESILKWELRFAYVSKMVLLTANLFQRINLRIYYRKPILGTCSDPIVKEPPWAASEYNLHDILRLAYNLTDFLRSTACDSHLTNNTVKNVAFWSAFYNICNG